MVLTGEDPSTGRKICHSATASTTNLTWTDLGSNTGLRSEKPASRRLSHGTAFRTKGRLNYTQTPTVWTKHKVFVR
jgi:hypothetical protein